MEQKEFNRIFSADLDFPLNVRFINQDSTEMHAHEFTELVIILDGYGKHITEFGEHDLEKGNVFVIPQGGKHSYEDAHELKLMNVLFTPDKLPIPLLDYYKLPGFNALFSLSHEFCRKKRFYPFFSLAPEQFDRVNSLLNFMQKECTELPSGYRLCLLGYFISLLINLARDYNNYQVENRRTPLRITMVLDRLHSRYMEHFTLDQLVKNSGMSKSSFMRSFHDATGTSPINYLLRIRIMQACKSLQSSQMSIGEISDQTGFTDSDYFSRTFRKFTGQTPREYRKNILT